MKLCMQTYILAGLCLLDLISTLWLLRYKGAAEANPLMASFLAHGAGAFILAKLAFVLPPLLCIEWARQHKPHFVRGAANLAIAGYLGIYLLGVARANSAAIINAPGTDDPVQKALWTKLQQTIHEKQRPHARIGR